MQIGMQAVKRYEAEDLDVPTLIKPEKNLQTNTHYSLLYTKENLIPFSLNIKVRKDNKKSLQNIPSFSNITNDNYKDYIKDKYNGMAIRLGQPLDDTYYNVLIDIDDKDEKDVENGMIKWLELTKGLKITTPTQKTGNNGLHFLYKLTLEQMNALPRSITRLQIDSVSYSIDYKAQNQFQLVEPSKYDGKSYKWIINTTAEIEIMPDWLYNLLLNNDKEKTKNDTNKKTNEYTQDENTILKYYISDANCKKMLKMLPKDYLEDTDKWLKITTVLKFSGNKKDLWDEWSKKSSRYDKNANEIFWQNARNILNINYLINICKETNQKLKYINPTMDYIPINYDNYKFHKEFLKLEDLDLDNKKNPRFIKPSTIENALKKYRIVIIHSGTGTGKSASSIKVMKKIKKQIMSIVSRMCLATEHVNTFKKNKIIIQSYKEVGVDYSKSIAIQIDSILKYENKQDFSDSIVFLDEANSLFDYILNSTTLANKRIRVITILNRILLTAHKIIAADADISDLVLKYFDIYAKQDEVTYIQNPFKHYKNVIAYDYEDEATIINKIVEKIQDGEYFVCCFDTKKQLKEVYETIIKKCKELEIFDESTFIYHASEEGEKVVDVSTQWIRKRVFISPIVLFGLDFTIDTKQDVFVFAKGGTINPLQMYQQMTRTRAIKNAHFFFNTTNQKLEFTKLEQIKTHYESNSQLYRKELMEFIDFEFDKNGMKLINTQFMDLFYISKYFNNIMRSDYKYHFIALLEKNGFKIESVESTKKKPNKAELKKIKDSIKAKTDANFEAYVTDAKVNELYAEKMDKTLELLQITKKELVEYKDIVANLDDHFGLMNLCKTPESIMTKQAEKVQNELEVHFNESTFNKIKLLEKIEVLLNIDRLDIDHDKHKDKFKDNIVMDKVTHELYQKLFYSEASIPTTFKDAYGLLINGYKHIAGKDIIETKQTSTIINKNGKREKFNFYKSYLNERRMKNNIDLFKKRNNFISIKKNILDKLNIEVKESKKSILKCRNLDYDLDFD